MWTHGARIIAATIAFFGLIATCPAGAPEGTPVPFFSKMKWGMSKQELLGLGFTEWRGNALNEGPRENLYLPTVKLYGVDYRLVAAMATRANGSKYLIGINMARQPCDKDIYLRAKSKTSLKFKFKSETESDGTTFSEFEDERGNNILLAYYCGKERSHNGWSILNSNAR